MRNKITAIKAHIDQNRYHIRDLAIAGVTLAVITFVIVKSCDDDPDAPDLYFLVGHES